MTSIGSILFTGCSSLTNLSIPNGVTDIGYSTFDNSTITTITLTGDVTIGSNTHSVITKALITTYEARGRTSGTYLYNGTTWSKQ